MLGESGFFLKTGGYGPWKDHKHGSWKGPLHLDGEYLADCWSDDTSAATELVAAGVVAAVAEQAAKLNTNTRYITDQAIEYAERLIALAPPGLTSLRTTPAAMMRRSSSSWPEGYN